MSIYLGLSVLHLNHSQNWALNVDLGTGTLFILPGIVRAKPVSPWNLCSGVGDLTSERCLPLYLAYTSAQCGGYWCILEKHPGRLGAYSQRK